MAVVERSPVQQPVERETFPFGIEFQKALLKLLTRDTGFANAAMRYIRPEFFENEVLVWAYRYMIKYSETYNAVPSLKVILEETRKLDSTIQEIYQVTLESVSVSDLSVEGWLRDQTLDFIKRNVFVAAYKESREKYNDGSITEAYDLMMGALDEIHQTDWEVPDRTFFFEDFGQRVSDRLSRDPNEDTIATGIHELDAVLGGGLSLGELGIWVAYPKAGKSTMLVNHGVQSVRRGMHNTLHAVFEGSRKQVENRYDTAFSKEAYSRVKHGQYSDEVLRQVNFEYEMYKRRLVVRGFTERWDYTIADVHDEMRELSRLYDWDPRLIIIDYGDLLRSRWKKKSTETEEQRAAFRDMKSLANRGYAIWTASQAQRPSKDTDSTPQVLYARNIAECYDKVRVADFLGSINQTKEEKEALQMRLFAELYRDNEAGKILPVKADFSRMLITVVRDPGEAVLPAVVPTGLGYGSEAKPPSQQRAPV
jgi:hypothetical protein